MLILAFSKIRYRIEIKGKKAVTDLSMKAFGTRIKMMRAFKKYTLLFISVFIVTLLFVEFKNQTFQKPQVQLISSPKWSLSSSQIQEFEAIKSHLISQYSVLSLLFQTPKLFDKIKALDFIENVYWSWSFSHPIQIKAQVAQPSALYFENQIWFLVDKKGKLLKKVSSSQTLDLPIFKSKELLEDPILRSQSFKILEAFKSKESPIKDYMVSEIHKDKRGIFVILSEGYRVYLSSKNLITQLRRVKEVLDYVKIKALEVEFIDAQLVKKVLVRPQKRKKVTSHPRF